MILQLFMMSEDLLFRLFFGFWHPAFNIRESKNSKRYTEVAYNNLICNPLSVQHRLYQKAIQFRLQIFLMYFLSEKSMKVIPLGHQIFAKEMLISSKNLLVRGSAHFLKHSIRYICTVNFRVNQTHVCDNLIFKKYLSSFDVLD